MLFSCVEEFRRTKEKAIQLACGGKKKGSAAANAKAEAAVVTHAVVYVAK